MSSLSSSSLSSGEEVRVRRKRRTRRETNVKAVERSLVEAITEEKEDHRAIIETVVISVKKAETTMNTGVAVLIALLPNNSFMHVVYVTLNRFKRTLYYHITSSQQKT
jgi:predicted transcriptional regulator